MADSRIEKQLKKILGESVVTEPPQSRVEVLVQEIIDQGGGGGGASILMVNVEYTSDIDYEYFTLDKTWQEIHECMVNGGIVCTQGQYNNGDTICISDRSMVSACGEDGENYFVEDVGHTYYCVSASGYPQDKMSLK